MNNKFSTVKGVLFLLVCLIAATANASIKTKDPATTLQQLMTQHQGKIIYLDFWASWCIPCRQSFPWLNKLQLQYPESAFKIISINLDNNQAFADKFLTEVPASFDIIYDAKGKIAKQFKLKGMPSSFIFNRQGELVARHQGFNQQKAKAFERELALLISKNQ